ncbi:MAG: family 16 glycosylhydrolase [Acholeplasmataceae bacterium]
MKKTLLLELLLLSMTLMACTLETLPVVGNRPDIEGLETIETFIGATIDLMSGVSAYDIEDGDMTSSVIITNLNELPINQNEVMFDGEYIIYYEVTDSDNNSVTYQRRLSVTKITSICDETLEEYTMTFCDDFLTAAIPNQFGIDTTKWRFQTGDGSQYGIPGWGNNELQYYQEENAFVANGLLNIEAKAESVGGKFYTSARLWSNGLFSQTFGRFEARIKLPVGDGLWPAFWLLPQTETYGGWAASGEIDIMEARGRLPGEMSGAIHFGGAWPNNTYVSETYALPNGESINEFQVYAIEWDETSIRWYVDDVNFYTVTEWFSEGNPFPAPFDQPFYILLNLAIGGVFDNNIVPPASLFEDQVLMQVDYVRVFTID